MLVHQWWVLYSACALLSFSSVKRPHHHSHNVLLPLAWLVTVTVQNHIHHTTPHWSTNTKFYTYIQISLTELLNETLIIHFWTNIKLIGKIKPPYDIHFVCTLGELNPGPASHYYYYYYYWVSWLANLLFKFNSDLQVCQAWRYIRLMRLRDLTSLPNTSSCSSIVLCLISCTYQEPLVFLISLLVVSSGWTLQVACECFSAALHHNCKF